MQPYSFHHGLILRTPAYPLGIAISDVINLQGLLENIYFKNAIFLASAAFYEALFKKGFRVDALNEKQVHTLKNYVNRMQYRTTPFGLFAGISYLEWQKESLTEFIVMGAPSYFLKPTFPAISVAFIGFPENFLESGYFVNPTLYRCNKEYRYLYASQKPNSNEVSYNIAAIQYQSFLEPLRKHCCSIRTGSEIIAFFNALSDIEPKQLQELLGGLITEQILLPANKDGVIIPRDIGRHPDQPQCYPTMDLNSILISSSVTGLSDGRKALYTNLFKSIHHGTLPLSYQDKILDGLHAIEKLKHPSTHKSLESFKESFKEKFEEQCIPILIALDPEMGIGYSNTASGFVSQELLEGVHFFRDKIRKAIEWTPVHSMLIDKLQENNSDGINLTDADLLALPDDERGLPPAPGISVLFRVLADVIYIESAGGATASALSGRFSPMDKHIDEACLDVAANEAIHNPNVIFAEINSIQESHAANIEQRNSFYEYEIPLMVASTLEQQQQILISDIFIAVRDDRIILWSGSLKKEIIPRLSSAYNYNRSNLNIYRLLCDLQHQGIRSDFQFELSDYFPGLGFYPRVSYKDTILSLATWHIKKEEINQVISQGRNIGQVAAFKAFAKARKLPDWIAITKGDQQLVYNTGLEHDIFDLMDQLSGPENSILKEHPFVSGYQIITDTKGSNYCNQFVALLRHQQEVYKGISPDAFRFQNLAKVKRVDKQWLYFKLYCHPSTADVLLAGFIAPLINGLNKKNRKLLHFFVRYEDRDGFHIRLRIYCPDKPSLAETWTKCQDCFGDLMDKGLLSSLKTDFYKRELERYGSKYMAEVESIFCSSSNWALDLLQKQCDQSTLIIELLAAMKLILHHFSYSPEEMLLFSRNSFLALKREFDKGNNIINDLGINLRKFRGVLFDRLQVVTSQLYDQPVIVQCMSEINELSQSIKDDKKRSIMCNNLIHMHMNRIIPVQEREQEMILYFYLWKYYESLSARAKHASNLL